ncbi:DUF1761 domain-containing protein [Abyssibius alkaniclasticus]|uniref:DUF1761 family protein n=1 Tax=Abyssibius alkaniclasticus TaxID=2881234 RepID=UPI002363FEEE|nr:DUF1761 family protein [Abyssibius alkaniclasticus]UPH72665.1 DUF1761 domain-containing protein [Abyssibius alkaniclasticus]
MELNWLAFIIGGIAAFMAGWAWYSPMLFGKGWAAGSKVELGSASSMPVFAMVAQLVAVFLLSFVVAITATTDALITAIAAILAASAFVVSSGAFVKKSTYALCVDGGYIILSGVIMIAIHAII